MDSLDEELEKLEMDRGDEELISELDDLADRIYELLINGRKRNSEEESDRLGTLILYNTGYRSDGLKNFLVKAGAAAKQKGSTYGHQYLEERVANIDSVIEKNGLTGTDGKYCRQRFHLNVK